MTLGKVATQLPGEADTATIPAGAVCTLSSATTQSIQSLSVSGTLTLGSPSPSGETGTIDAVMASVGLGGILDIGDPGAGTAGDLTVSGLMSVMGGVMSVGGVNGSGGTLDVNTMTSSFSMTPNINVNTGGEIEVKTSAGLSGDTVVAGGEIKAENINDTQGAAVTLGGTGSVSGTGKLSAEINASFTFASGGTWTIGLGNPVGSALNDGQFYVEGTLLFDTNIQPAGDITLSSGGTISGTGSYTDGTTFTWEGGTLGPAGGTTIFSSGDFKTVGPGTNIYTLGASLLNESAFTDLGGSGTLVLNSGVIFDNAVGTVDVSLSSIVDAGIMGGSGLFENTGGTGSTLDFQAPSSTPTVIAANFTNLGILEVVGSSAATLAPSFGATDDLDGSLSLEGDLTLEGAIAAPSGLLVNPGGGSLKIGSSNFSSTLTLGSGSTSVLDGNVEVTKTGTLTGSSAVTVGTGTLTLDLGSVTSIGSYQQDSTGTLALQAAMDPMPTSSSLTVSGSAQLAGAVSMDFLNGYTPTSGTVFTVLKAGSIGATSTRHPPT